MNLWEQQDVWVEFGKLDTSSLDPSFILLWSWIEKVLGHSVKCYLFHCVPTLANPDDYMFLNLYFWYVNQNKNKYVLLNYFH